MLLLWILTCIIIYFVITIITTITIIITITIILTHDQCGCGILLHWRRSAVHRPAGAPVRAQGVYEYPCPARSLSHLHSPSPPPRVLFLLFLLFLGGLFPGTQIMLIKPCILFIFSFFFGFRFLVFAFATISWISFFARREDNKAKSSWHWFHSE